MRRSPYGRKKPRKSLKRQLPEIQAENNPFAHLKRTPAELILDEGVGRPKTIFHAMVVLNELTPVGIHLFSESPFAGHQELTLNIPSLRNFFIKGKVISCNETPVNPGIMSARSFHYRIELSFSFQTEAERDAVREYCSYLKAAFLASAA
jgi:hypothetical protein